MKYERAPFQVGGYTILIDEEDVHILNEYKWYVALTGYYNNPYVVATVYDPHQRRVWLHHIIMGRTKVDHINGNALDNRRENLRPFEGAQNNYNKRPQRRNKFHSKYKGVKLLPSGRWTARITYQYETYHLGVFDTEIEAARAYDIKAREFFGEFAHANL